MAGPRPTPYEARLEHLLDVVQELSLARSLADVTLIVRVAARALTGADGATFVLRDEDHCSYVDEDAIGPLWKGLRFPLQTCISGWAMLHAEAVAIPDIYLDDRIPHDAYRPTFVKSLVMVPIRSLDPVGAIGTYWATERVPSDEEVRILQALANATAIALEHVRVLEGLELLVRRRTADLRAELSERLAVEEEVRQLSLTDELTGLANRRGFVLLAEHARSEARADGRTGHLAFIDVDGLKVVNDERGHAAGDALLEATARILVAGLGDGAIIARLGGDEFATWSADHDGPAIEERLEAARGAVEPGLDDLCPAFSLGVVADDGERPLDDVLHQADLAMYAAKQAGRAGRAGSSTTRRAPRS